VEALLDDRLNQLGKIRAAADLRSFWQAEVQLGQIPD
jgi:hypothetical protein